MVDTAAVTILLALSTTLALVLMEIVTSHVGHEIVGPSDELLAKQMEKGIDG